MGRRRRGLLAAGAVVVVGGAAWLAASASGSGGPSTAARAAPPAATAPPQSGDAPAPGRVAGAAGAAATTAVVADVVDGDTLTLSDGRRVRLAQVDAPETHQCFGSESTAALRALAPAGEQVTLRRPSNGPARDRYGRTLAEVSVNGESIDERLVRDGAAEWYDEFAHEDPDIARRLAGAEREARASGRGLWSACKGGARAPSGRTAAPPTTTAEAVPAGGCDAAYPDFCIPAGPPDLDCSDVDGGDFTVRSPDPHGFDRDRDGVGCEG